MPKKAKLSKAEKLNRAIERWQMKQEAAVIMLRRSAEDLAKLHRKRRRMLREATPTELSSPVMRALDKAIPKPAAIPSATQVESPKDDGLDIPAWMRRGQATQQAVDATISEASKRLAALPNPNAPEKRAVRRKVERQKLDAELTGKRRKMPLAGKEALRKIDESK